MLEKIAEQLSVSIVELMQAKRIPEEKISKEDAETAVHETVNQAKKQALQKNRRVMAVTACVAVLVCICAHLALKMVNRALDAWAEEQWVYLPEEGGYYFMGEKPVFLEEK